MPFEKGKSGNPKGRTIGSRIKQEKHVKVTLDKCLDTALSNVVESANNGNLDACMFVIDSILSIDRSKG